MALTNAQALDVVAGCVNGVSGQSPSPNQTLKQGGITDPGRLGAFKSAVVTNPQRGVKSHQHEIEASALSGVAVDDFVQATADVVRANATPISAGELLSVDAASGAAPSKRKRKAKKRKAKKGKTAPTTKKKARKSTSKRKRGTKKR